MHLLDADRIEVVEADRNYVLLRAGRDAFQTRSTLQQAEAALQFQPMLRLSRSCLVNMNHVREVSRTPRGDFILVVSGGTTVTSSEGFREKVRDYLSGLKISPTWGGAARSGVTQVPFSEHIRVLPGSSAFRRLSAFNHLESTQARDCRRINDMKSAAAMVALAMTLLPLPTLAHAHLAEAQPADGSILTAPPTQFLLKFSEAAHLTALSLLRAGDAKAQKLGPLPAAASTSFSIAAPRLSAGTFTLTYRVVAADDNHLSSGTVRFRLSSAP
jgi:methionine-rich copper-binding protein CopC